MNKEETEEYRAGHNAERCTMSKKEIRNKSVYCMLLDQWIALNYCENVCRAADLR